MGYPFAFPMPSSTTLRRRFLITQQKNGIIQLESSGGVVYRIRDNKLETVICGRSVPRIWGLPKGTPKRSESREDTALREVNEETGLEVRLEDYIGSIEYWFACPDGVRCRKAVYYYLMSATGGDVSLHDHEFDDVRWVSAEEALRTLTYENEVKIVENALSLVSQKARASR
jgi:8-oxo-dGTP pyrophosphatase MutT (NUDIX family)